MKRSYLVVVLTLFCSLQYVTAAQAQPSKKEKQRAKVIFQEAEAAAAEQRYEESARKYLEAYELFPASDFLYNAAKMYRFAGDKTRAAEYYRAYLSADPEGEGSTEAQAALTKLEDELAEQKRLAEEKDEDRMRREAAVVKAAKWDAAKRETGADAVVSTPKPRKEDNDAGQPLRIAGFAGLSVGAVLIGVGGYYGFEARRISNEVSASNEFMPALEAEGERAQTRALIFSGIGAATLIGGGVLYFISRKDSGERSSLTLVPSIAGDSVGAVAVGRF